MIKGKKDKQRSTKYYNKDRVTRTPIKTGGELTFNPLHIFLAPIILNWFQLKSNSVSEAFSPENNYLGIFKYAYFFNVYCYFIL